MPLATLSKVAGALPSVAEQTLQDIIDVRDPPAFFCLTAHGPHVRTAVRTQDPDTKLLRSVAGSVRETTEKTVRERCATTPCAGVTSRHASSILTAVPVTRARTQDAQVDGFVGEDAKLAAGRRQG